MNKDPQVTADLTALAESEDINDWIKAAKDPKCPSELLDKMITNEDFPWGEPEADEFIIIVARNPNTPEEHLTPLGEEDFDSEVHLSLASNPSCPTDLLKDLASRSALLKETVLKNPSYTPKDKAMNVKDLINLLEKHPNAQVAFFDDNADEYGDFGGDVEIFVDDIDSWPLEDNETYIYIRSSVDLKITDSVKN
jgi:hypothetical protein